MASNNLFVTVAKAPVEARESLAESLAPLQGLTVAEFMAEVGKVEERAEKEKEKAERKAATEARNAAIEVLNGESDEVTVTLSPEELEAVEGILESIAALKADQKADAFLVVEGITGMDLTFSVSGLKAKTGPTGGGKPPADKPRDFVDENGERVLGALNVWAEANLSEEELEELDDKPESLLDRTKKGTLAGGKKLERRLLSKGFLVSSPL